MKVVEPGSVPVIIWVHFHYEKLIMVVKPLNVLNWRVGTIFTRALSAEKNESSLQDASADFINLTSSKAGSSHAGNIIVERKF